MRRPLGNLGLSDRKLSSSSRGLRRDTRGYYQGVGMPGGLAGLVLPLSKCLVNRDSELDRVVPGGGFSSLIMRACHGLSWDTPAGFKLSSAVPMIMWQVGLLNLRL